MAFMQDSTQTIAKSARRFFSGTMLSRLTGLLRDVAMGAAFGTQEAVATFLVAFRLAHLMRRLLGEGALQTAFVPKFEQIRQHDPQKAGVFFRDLNIVLTLVLSLIIAAVMLVLGGALVFLEMSPGNRDIAFLTFLMMPSLLFICLFGLNAGLLQCEKSFFTPSLAPVAFNLVWVLGVLCLWTVPPKEAMPWLAGFVILACLAQWLFTLPKVLAILRKLGLKEIWQNVPLYTQELRGMLKPFLLGITGVAASQINNALDPLFARYADPEGPAYLWYAIRMQQLPLALFGIAISGALLPPLSRACEGKDWPKFRHFVDMALRRGLALMLPITLAIFLLGDRSINVLYGRGKFDSHAILHTTQCLWGYGAGLIPMTLVLFLAPAFYAQHNYRLPTIASICSVVLNLALNTLFVSWLNWGAASVAWATSLCAWLNFALLAWALHQSTGSYISQDFWQQFGKVTFTTVASAAVCMLAMGAVGQAMPLHEIAMGLPASFPRRFAEQAMQLLFPAAIFGGAILVIARLIRCEDILSLLKR